MRTWTRRIPAVLLAVPLLLPSSATADAETNAKNIEQLQRDVAQLRKDIDQLRRDLTDNGARGAAAAEELRAIRMLMEQMLRRQDELLAHLARRQDTVARESGFRGLDPARTVVPTLGTITLQNQYSAPATVIVNGVPYRVEPGQVRSVSAPLGTFNYEVEVDGYGLTVPLRSEVLRSAGHRITIFPRVGG